MPRRLRKQLAEFLRQRRGATPYAEFARKLGVSSSSLQRMEMGEQNVTLDTLDEIASRLKCSVADIFVDP
ncbi:MAG TPA: helix-turn-helix transcriptional regulator [Chthoniobacteraceae bacterium]|nr:helix-turn-helix transcriptional regulator [Chthoniobacteraceae bacterium]